MKLKNKLTLFQILVVILTIGLLCSVFTYKINGYADNEINNYKKEVTQLKKKELQDLVALAESTVNSYYEKSTNIAALKKDKAEDIKRVIDACYTQITSFIRNNEKIMSRSEIETGIKKLISSIRYSDGNYVWINDMHPRMIMHPTSPELNGKDVSATTDSTGKHLFKEMVNICSKNGEGMVSYMWKKPGERKETLKISYVKRIPQLDWIIGTGAWVDDITSDMKEEALERLSGMRLENGNYFWVNGMDYTMIMHPIKPQLNGSNLKNLTDSKGKFFFREMIEECASSGEGMTRYYWPKPGKQEDVPKLSYVKLFKPWGWVIGMGVYLDSIDEAVALKKQNQNQTVRNILGVIAMLAVAIGLAAGLASRVFAARITSKIGAEPEDLSHVAKEMSQGNINLGIEAEHERGAYKSIALMMDRICHTISEVQNACENVSAGSEELSASAQSMSQGATEQAAAVEELSASMDKIVTGIESNEKNTDRAEKMAMQAASDTIRGGKAVQETLKAMEKITERTAIIEEISRQTNLLALNAAIEAARAGEHGKGFAVVASEVRKLAERSGNAASEISEISSESLKTAKNTKELLEKIIPEIENTSNIVQEIAASSKEQSSNIGSLKNATEELDSVIQQNASSSEQVAATSEELSSQAQMLQQAILFFKVDKD